jgi:hypothetical protein
MKHTIMFGILIFQTVYVIHATYQPHKAPLPSACLQTLDTCFHTCPPIHNTQAACAIKKECLEYCNFHLITQSQSYKCYRRCTTIECPSPSVCIPACFKETEAGMCRNNCRNIFPKCIHKCEQLYEWEIAPCVRCCYAQEQMCQKRCCTT